MMTFTRISGAEAFANVIGNHSAVIPKKDDPESRLETPVSPILEPGFKLDESDSIFTIGSCFARRIEEGLSKVGLDVPAFRIEIPKEELHKGCITPRAILNKYTPFSMTNEVRGAFELIDLNKSLLEVKEGQFLDQQLHAPTLVSLERAQERRAYINTFNKTAIEGAKLIVITMGLVEAWFDTKADMYINQTPAFHAVKNDPDRFQFEVLSPTAAIAEAISLIELFNKYGAPDHHVMLTVSPIPIGRTFTGNDVIMANCYSKSVLRVAAEVVAQKFPHVDYVPTYEAITLGDRNATWANDNIHVLAGVVEHNIERIIKAYTGVS